MATPMTGRQHRRWWRKLRRYHHGNRDAIGAELLRTPS